MRLVDLVGVAGMRACGCRLVLDLGCMLLSACRHGDRGLDLARVARLTCSSAMVRMEDGGAAAPHMRLERDGYNGMQSRGGFVNHVWVVDWCWQQSSLTHLHVACAGWSASREGCGHVGFGELRAKAYLRRGRCRYRWRLTSFPPWRCRRGAPSFPSSSWPRALQE